MHRTVLIFFSCFVSWGSAAPCSSLGAETECQKELREWQEGMNKFPPVIGGRIPVCDAEGNYAPKQCSGSQCYCVTKNGAVIEGYNVNRWEAEDQTCKCARDFQEYRELNLIGKTFRCSANGSYEPKQCTGSVCYCADEDGKQIGPGVHISEFNELVC